MMKFPIYVLAILLLVNVRADEEEAKLVPPKDMPQEKQIEKLEEMSDAVNRKIESTSAPLIPEPSLTQEEKVEQLKEMSDGSFFSRELTKKLATSESPEPTNLTKEESSKILSEEITRRLDTEAV